MPLSMNCCASRLLALATLSAWYGHVALAQEPIAAPSSEPVQVTPGAVIIEGEIIAPPTLEDIMQRFREMLEEERTLAPMERPLAGGGIEVYTRYGRFCIAPLPTYIASSDLTGGLTLASRCAMF
jgi:hypothetical protein